jgi:hypothetical protein
MLGLMQLAWERSKGDINCVVNCAFGAIVFIGVWGVAFVVQFINLRTWVNFTLPPDATDISGAIMLAEIYAFINTICLLLLLAIIFCLADYALNFILLCYYYDNKSWECVKLAKSISVAIDRSITKFFDNSNRNAVRARETFQREITEAISYLKSDTDL